jgi:alpha-beta hydrolase superfamily lysophospholipase
MLVAGVAIAVFYRDYEPTILNPGPRSTATPAVLGIPFERVAIPSGGRRLDSFIVPALPSCAAPASVLLYHGVGETIADWIGAQKFLRAHCIASMVFDYSGHGMSSPHGSFRHLDEDAAAAYAAFVAKAPQGRHCVMSFSMGAGPLLDVAPRFTPAPDCVIVASAFTSLRAFAVVHGTPAWVMAMVPDDWDNEKAIAHLRAPLLIVHSRADRTNPFWMGERLYAAAPQPKHFAPLTGFRHNAPYMTPNEAWWTPAMRFIRGDR